MIYEKQLCSNCVKELNQKRFLRAPMEILKAVLCPVDWEWMKSQREFKNPNVPRELGK